MRNARRSLAFALISMSIGCGGGGSSDKAAPPTALTPTPSPAPTPAPNQQVGNVHSYDVDAALLALFSGQFPEGKATARIDGLSFDLKVTPRGVGPNAAPPMGSTAPLPTYRSSYVSLQLTASGFSEAHDLGHLFERAPTRLVGATMNTAFMPTIYADASNPTPIPPTAAAVGDSQEMLRGPRYEQDYSAGFDKPPIRVPLPGYLARGWRLEPDTSDAAFLCLTDELDEGTSKGTDDYCFSILPDGRPTGRFRATITDTDTGLRHEFE